MAPHKLLIRFILQLVSIEFALSDQDNLEKMPSEEVYRLIDNEGGHKYVVNLFNQQPGNQTTRGALEWYGPFCTGALWTYNIVLTTCRCLGEFPDVEGSPVNYPVENVLYIAGTKHLNFTHADSHLEAQIRMAYAVYLHPNCTSYWNNKYRIGRVDNDMAIAVMRRDFNPSATIGLMQVLDYNISTFKRSFNSLRKRERCFSSGWSFKDWSQGRRIPNDYKKQLWPRLIVRVVDDSDCNGYISFDEMFYPKYPVIPDTSDKICTFSRAPTCQGEEGALLHCGYYAMGFYSFNVKTCDPHFPGVFTSLVSYLKWFGKERGPWDTRLDEHFNSIIPETTEIVYEDK